MWVARRSEVISVSSLPGSRLMESDDEPIITGKCTVILPKGVGDLE